MRLCSVCGKQMSLEGIVDSKDPNIQLPISYECLPCELRKEEDIDLQSEAEYLYSLNDPI